jgi:hypothetical protein|tara:strand:+ start:45 stop:461 length:417 start_codon:yes stop_codon:yes gene_type:complete
MTENNKAVRAQLSKVFEADQADLTSFFNEVVAYGMGVIASTNHDNNIVLGEAELDQIKQGLEVQSTKAFARFARDFKDASIENSADFDGFYEYPVLRHYQQDYAIQKDLLGRSFDEEAAILEYLALESVYQTAKAKLV